MVPAALVVYVGVVAGWELLRLTPVQHVSAFEVVDIFGAWLYAPAIPLLALAIAARTPRAVALLAVPLVLFAADYGAVFLPRLSAQPPSGTPIRVLTANLVFWDVDAAGFTATVAREQPQPDVVAVQELGVRMAGPLADALRDAYPYQALAPAAGASGIGVFSRIPFDSIEPADNGPQPGACICQSVAFRAGNQPVELLNAHPLAPDVDFHYVLGLPIPTRFDDRLNQPDRRKLLERIDSRSLPLILAGDLNTADRQPYYRELRSRLDDAHWDAGWGFGWTFPSAPVGYAPIPLVRIDYVLFSKDWQASHERTGYFPSSDHRYVVADLVLT